MPLNQHLECKILVYKSNIIELEYVVVNVLDDIRQEVVAERLSRGKEQGGAVSSEREPAYSTVTDFARFRG
jgi:hypothetical protein